MSDPSSPSYGPWASPAQSATRRQDSDPSDLSGSYYAHALGHASESGSAPRDEADADERRRRRELAFTTTPSPSPVKTQPPPPLRRRKTGPAFIYATPGTRALAGLLDGAMLALALAPGITLLLVELVLPGTIVLMLGLLGLATLQSALTVAHGQSLAKRWLGLRLIDAEGERVSYVRAVVMRGGVMTVAYVASAGVLFVAELILLLRERPCLADRLAHTTVIEARTPGDPYAGQTGD